MYKICIINKYYWRMAYNEKLLPDFYQIKLLLVQEFLITKALIITTPFG